MTKSTLKISDKISLPRDAVTQTFADIGRKGSGKTYLATMKAEQMLDIHAQVVAIDPVGNWWGLRVAADGKSKGKEIFVIGGDHGDVPLVPEAGARIAKLLVEKSVSAVIDISSFRLGERKRFCADFGEELLHLKKRQRTPMHLFLEEAQLIIPQRVGPEEARMVGAFEQIVRLGRNYGIGCTLVTQRPQSVNKEVLSQVECLCVLQVTGPHERKALEEWVQEVGADRTLIGELPGLARGEGYIWSPSWLRKFERVHFSTKQTFDASATPEVGKATRQASLSAVDVDMLKRDMAEVVEQAEKDDPVKLRKTIGELKQKLAVSERNYSEIAASPKFEKPSEVEIRRALKPLLEPYKVKIQEWRRYAKDIESIIEAATQKSHMLKPPKDMPAEIIVREAEKMFEKPKRVEIKELTPSRMPVSVPSETRDGITGPEQRVLDALAWCESIGMQASPQEMVAFLSGYSHYRSTGYTNPRGYLKSKGLLTYAQGNVSLTPEGRALASPSPTPLTTDELHRIVLEKLTGPERKVLEPLLRAYPSAISNANLCAEAGYEHERSTGYTNPRGYLKSKGLVEYGNGVVKAADILFI